MYRLFSGKRKTLYKWLMIFFLGIVSLGMVLTLAPLPNNGSAGMQPNVLATIYGNKITVQDLQRAIESQLSNTGNDSQAISHLADSALNQMVLHEAFVTQAQKMGLEVSNPELVAALHGIPYLYQNGQFVGMQAYEAMLAEQGLTVPQFEAELRESVLIQKLRDAVTDAVQVTPDEVHEAFQRQNAKARIKYVLFEPSDFTGDVKVTPKALASYFLANQTKYKLPEQRQVKYVIVSQDAVRSEVNVTDAQIERYYHSHLADFSVPDKVKVSHILFKTTGETPQQAAQTKATAEKVLARIRAGANFAEMAKKYSQDTGSAAQGGELGWIQRGQTVKAFENAAFSMKPGQISGLIKTEYGYHIIKVEDRQYAHVETLEEAKASIQSELEKQDLKAAQQALANTVMHQAQSNPANFDAVAKQYGLQHGQTPLFAYDQAVPDLGNNQAFENLAFQLPVNSVGQPIEVPKGVAVIEVTQIVPEHLPKLDEVESKVEQDYRTAQSQGLARERAQQFAALCKTGDFAKLAKQNGYQVQESKDFTVEDQLANLIPGSALSSAFTLQPGQTSHAISVGSTSVVFQVVSHTPANEADYAAQKASLSTQLLEQKRDLAFEIYQTTLKDRLLRTGKLKINNSALKAFLAGYQQNS
jgi:peptidyl-prolyl cis-trans isomerase D